MRLIAYMKPYAHWVIFALLLVLGLTAFDLYRPMLVGDAIDTFGANGDYDVIIATAIKYAVVLALSFAFNVAQTWILQKTGQNIILQMRKDLYRHIQSLGSRYFDITPVGKLVTRVTNDVEALNEMYSGILVQLFRNIVKIVGLAGVMLVLDVRLAAISFVLMPLVIGLTVLCQKIARNIYRLYRTRLTDINTFLSEHLSGMKIIQIFGRQERKFEEFHDKNTKLYKAFYREMLMYAVFVSRFCLFHQKHQILHLLIACTCDHTFLQTNLFLICHKNSTNQNPWSFKFFPVFRNDSKLDG